MGLWDGRSQSIFQVQGMLLRWDCHLELWDQVGLLHGHINHSKSFQELCKMCGQFRGPFSDCRQQQYLRCVVIGTHGAHVLAHMVDALKLKRP
jgi:hypothetical protein